jgi:phosphoglucomutase
MSKLLPLAESAHNNIIQGSIQQIPFFTNYGYHPKFDQFDFNKVENPAARDLATRLSEIHTKMKDKLLKAQDRQKDNADKSRKAHPIILEIRYS